MGSPPLARELLELPTYSACIVGITPARAGITCCRLYCYKLPEDHPRSRGNYVTICSASTFRTGSPPLARELPMLRQLISKWGRITPARAGITALSSTEMLPLRDHPRSRGNYLEDPVPVPNAVGSPPLARELPYLDYILPLVPQDHPRSRGNYFTFIGSNSSHAGSPPLARELLFQTRH